MTLDGVLGSTWTAIGTISEGTTSRLPVQTRRPTLSVRADGLSRVFTGCNSGRTTVRIDGVHALLRQHQGHPRGV